MLKILIYFILISLVNGSILTDRAYKAYKKGDYKRAFTLYTQDKTSKSTYNLAVFYEKGLGVERSKLTAIRLYEKYISDFQKDILSKDRSICSRKEKRYIKKSLKKLIKYRAGSNYTKLLKKLNSKCSTSNLNLSKLKQKDRAFLRNCPTAKRVVPNRYLKYAKRYSCSLYRKYPKTLKRHFLDLERVEKAINAQDERAKNRIKQRARVYTKAILREFKRQELQCVKRAKTNGIMDDCIVSYTLSAGDFLFEEYAQMLFDPIALASKKEREEYRRRRAMKVSKESREKVISTIKKELRNRDYIPFK